jgi:uncharacterized membrane protein YhaH (DUF805 family)
MNWFIDVVTKKYATFTGRAHRTEYWMFVLVYIVIAIVVSVVDGILKTGGILGGLLGLALLVPSIAVAVRRLHDTSRTGWWVLIALVPVIGFIVALVFMCLDGTPGSNEYGPNPKGIGAAPAAA